MVILDRVAMQLSTSILICVCYDYLIFYFHFSGLPSPTTKNRQFMMDWPASIWGYQPHQQPVARPVRQVAVDINQMVLRGVQAAQQHQRICHQNSRILHLGSIRRFSMISLLVVSTVQCIKLI
jgi:hypothetical protein